MHEKTSKTPARNFNPTSAPVALTSGAVLWYDGSITPP